MQDLNPTLRGEHLGEALRKLREEAKLSLAEVSAKLDVSPSKLSRLESGKRHVRYEDVAGLMTLYGVRGERRRMLIALAKEADQTGWLLRHTATQHTDTLRRIETKATEITEFQPNLVPGLLQTAPYMLAAAREVGAMDEDDAQQWMAERIRRQHEILSYPAPVLRAFIAEHALRNPVGGMEVLREQLNYLLEISRRPKVSIRIIPHLMFGHTGWNGGFVRYALPERTGVVCVDSRTFTMFVEDEDELGQYDETIRRLRAVALDEDDTARRIRALITELEGMAIE